jgi:hypothetical protein
MNTLIRKKGWPLESPDGDSGVFILYGRSGSGKSYTCREILSNNLSDDWNKLRVVEVYNNVAKTLFEKSGLTRGEVLKKTTTLKRQVSSTVLNQESSRSNVVFSLENEKGSIVIFDLMGSERTTDPIGLQSNKSLLELGALFRRLETEPDSLSFFRGTVINMMIKEALKTNVITFIGTVDEKDAYETTRTLAFIDGLKKVKLNRKYLDYLEQVLITINRLRNSLVLN